MGSVTVLTIKVSVTFLHEKYKSKTINNMKPEYDVKN